MYQKQSLVHSTGLSASELLETYQEQSLGHRTWPQAKGLACGRHSGSVRALLELLEQGDHPPGHRCQAGTPPGAVAGVHSLRHKVALQLLHGLTCLQGKEYGPVRQRHLDTGITISNRYELPAP